MRQVDIIVAADQESTWRSHLEAQDVKPLWIFASQDGQVLIKFILPSERSAEVLDDLEAFIEGKEVRLLVSPIESQLPRPEETEPKKQEAETEEGIQLGRFARISKSELHQDIAGPAQLSFNFIVMVLLSALVAGIGLLKDNVPVIIGAMVIAPFLAPNLAISFATTLGDIKLNRQALLTLLAATGLVLLVTIPWGVFDPSVKQIGFNPQVEYRDILLALACGFAGVLSLISIEAASLVGVMVAAALLPPLVMGGFLLGAGLFQEAAQALSLYAINLVCLNLAGITTFYVSGLRPARWWEQEKAGQQTRRALMVLGSMLLLLAGFIYLSQHDFQW